MSRPGRPHVGIRADASPSIGVGHVVRCLALAEELLERGCTVTIFGSVTVDWLAAPLERLAIEVVAAPDAPEALTSLLVEQGVDALVIDGYDIDARLGATARTAGLVVLAFHDGDFGAAQEADIHLDQNFGAVLHHSASSGAISLAGLDHALFRREVLDLADLPHADHAVPTVLAVFGGTDPNSAAEVVVPLLLATGLPLDLTCVVARPDLREAVDALPRAEGQSVTTIAPTPDVMRLAASSTVTLSAAGSSIWELLHLGVATGIVAVADNQEASYREVIDSGVAAPIGLLSELRRSEAARADAKATLRRLLDDPAYREDLGHRGRRLVDGKGRARVADVLLTTLGDRPD
ncbi:PseG/SpsG family protein [Knoellia subterranea]|uniref:Spore coat protein n=1 Tax=Knoellia subterranea KCTC 19937 TaxID=1385521 RepID=A0A0A0JMR6_9MICO|nr:hypothetical protein [Knoellia subterranea]KGN36916.1 hypothetical protein N803_16000 [Knoellia subterranea KCTC 19937]